MAIRTSNGAGTNILLIGLLGVGIIFSIYAAYLLVPMTWDSYSASNARIRSEQVKIEVNIDKNRQRLAPQLCPEYNAASFWRKQTELRNLSWCSDYAE